MINDIQKYTIRIYTTTGSTALTQMSYHTRAIHFWSRLDLILLHLFPTRSNSLRPRVGTGSENE